MKLVILIIILALAAGTTAGYLVGSTFLASPEVATVIANSYVAKAGPNDRYVLNYVCDGKLISSYDVDTDKLLGPAFSIRDARVIVGPTVKSDSGILARTKDILGGSVAGGLAAKVGKPLYRVLVAKDNNKYTVSGAIGLLSGFYLGIEIANRNIPPCDDFGALIFATSPELWKVLKGTIASRYALELLLHSPLSPALDQVTKDIQSNNVSSKTLALLGAFDEYHPPPASTPSWISLEHILTVYLPVAFGLTAAVLAGVLFIRADKAAALRKKVRAYKKTDMT